MERHTDRRVEKWTDRETDRQTGSRKWKSRATELGSKNKQSM